jgi:hypothetical protein
MTTSEEKGTPKMETPTRYYRSPDKEYDLVVAKAKRNGVSVSHATREALKKWITGGREYYLYHPSSNEPMGTIVLEDREALDHKLRGMDLWPVEWGYRPTAQS